ncbi:hypothetical protein EDE11_1661, partial [Methylomonas methanica]
SICTLNEAFHLHSRLIGRELILLNLAFLHSLKPRAAKQQSDILMA